MEFKTLQELCTEIIDCPHTTPEWKTEGIPVIRNYNLQNGFIDKSKLSFVDNDTYLQRIKRGMPQVDDIIFSREAPVGSVAIMPSNFRCCLGQRLVLLKVNKSICDPHYLLYVMLSNFVKKQYKTVEKTGSIVSNFNIGDLKNLVIPYVDIAIQKKIGRMCGMLDRKIAVNNLTIENLESMAKTLYDYWFVQFDFPDANGRPYKTSGGKMEWNETLSREIPAGWEVQKIGSLIKKQKSVKSIERKKYSVNGKYPIVDQSSEYIAGYTNDEVNALGDEESIIIFGDHTRILKYVDFPFAVGADGTQRIVSKNKERMPQVLFYYSLARIDLSNYGYARHYKFLKDLMIIVPQKDVASNFERQVKFWHQIISKKIRENRCLEKLREFILPMLMNGQVTFRQ